MKNFEIILNNIESLNKRLVNNKNFEKYLFLLTIILIITTCIINVFRIFDNALWLDEMRTVVACRMSFNEMTEFVVREGHSPLHYIFAWLVFNVFNLPLDNYHLYYFHITSIIPWFTTIILGLTIVKNWFGKIASCIFSICATLLFSSIYIALEVRMYSLCQLFMLITFLIIYKCYINSKVFDFILLSIFSLAAIYSHYFALPAISILYFIIIIYYWMHRKSDLWKPLLSLLITFISLIPWSIVCIQGKRGGVIADYHLNNDASILLFLNYIFSASYFSYLLLIIFVILAISTIKRCLLANNAKYLTWIMSGIVAVFGTFVLALIFSYIFFPIIDKWTLRYFLPEITILWLLLGIFIQNSRKQRLFTCIVLLLIILPGVAKLGLTTYREFKADVIHNQTFLIITNSLDLGNYVITDQLHMAIEPVYYGYFGLDKKHLLYIKESNIHSIPLIKDSLLILKEPIKEPLKEFIAQNGYSLCLLKENGLIGNITANVYRIVKSERNKV